MDDAGYIGVDVTEDIDDTTDEDADAEPEDDDDDDGLAEDVDEDGATSLGTKRPKRHSPYSGWQPTLQYASPSPHIPSLEQHIPSAPPLQLLPPLDGPHTPFRPFGVDVCGATKAVRQRRTTERILEYVFVLRNNRIEEKG